MSDTLAHLRLRLPRDIADLVGEYAFECDECVAMRVALKLCIANYIEDYGKYACLSVEYFNESIDIQVARVVDVFTLDHEEITSGTCCQCEDYEMVATTVKLHIDQLVMILAHRLELRHVFRGRLYDTRPMFSVHPTTVKRSDCRGYDDCDILGLMLRCLVLGSDYETLYGYGADYSDEINTPSLPPTIPGLIPTPTDEE